MAVDYFSIYFHLQVFTFHQAYGGLLFRDVNVEDPTPEHDVKGQGGPLPRQTGSKAQHIVPDVHSAKSDNNRHPGATHAGDVKSFSDFFVIIIEVEA